MKYIENGEIREGGFAKLNLVLHRLDQLLEKGMYCIVVDQDNNEYHAPKPIAKPSNQIAKPKYPSPKPMNLNAIAAHMKKPENVEKRKQARLDDASQWTRLRNS